MFKNLLLPLDLTNKHQPAIHAAADLAKTHHASITLLHVIETIPGVSVEEEKSFFDRLGKSAEAHLRKHADELSRQGIPCQHKVLCGHRVGEIVGYAGEIGADLILLTAPRLDLDRPTAGWGSLSYRVGFLSTCPVMLVK